MFLLLGDHAGNRVPERLHSLGVEAIDLVRHIALDLGVSPLGARLAEMLDAPFVEQRYSRLVIDCNRALRTDGSIASTSDGTSISGNTDVSDEDRHAREAEIFAPYHRTIGDLLTQRDAAGIETIVVSLHSFTPTMAGIARPWQVGVLHGGGDARFAASVLGALQSEPDLVVGDNEPYWMDDTDYTVPLHAFASARPYVEIEVRQDELATEAGLERAADILSKALVVAEQTWRGAAR